MGQVAAHLLCEGQPGMGSTSKTGLMGGTKDLEGEKESCINWLQGI